MNRKLIIRMLGALLLIEAAAMLPSLIVEGRIYHRCCRLAPDELLRCCALHALRNVPAF